MINLGSQGCHGLVFSSHYDEIQQLAPKNFSYKGAEELTKD